MTEERPYMGLLLSRQFHAKAGTRVMEVLHMAKSELSTPMCERWAAARGDQAIITAFLDALDPIPQQPGEEY